MTKSQHHNSSLSMEGDANSTSSSVLLAADSLLSKHSNNFVAGEEIPETTFEFDSDAILALAFLITAIVAAKRLVPYMPY